MVAGTKKYIFEAMRMAMFPANLIQVQRDFFGAHTHQLKDMEGTYHTRWQ
jgi:6-phosphogluconate dehydrogenase